MCDSEKHQVLRIMHRHANTIRAPPKPTSNARFLFILEETTTKHYRHM
jgi:hypothetical protein